MPLGMGHHPYYPRTADTRIYTEVAAMWRSNADLLPEDLIQHPAVHAMASDDGLDPAGFDLDNNFTDWSRTATIAWPAERRRLIMQADPAFAHLVVFAPSAAPDLLCVEPVSNTTDWLNAPRTGKGARDGYGGQILAPGEAVTASFRWQTHWSPDTD